MKLTNNEIISMAVKAWKKNKMTYKNDEWFIERLPQLKTFAEMVLKSHRQEIEDPYFLNDMDDDLDAIDLVISKYGEDAGGNPLDWDEWVNARKAISNIKALKNEDPYFLNVIDDELDAIERVISKYGEDENGNPLDWDEWVNARKAFDNIKALKNYET